MTNFEGLQRGSVFSRPNFPAPFLVVEVVNGAPSLLIGNVKPTFYRTDVPLGPPIWAHCSAFPAAGVFPSVDTSSITVILPTVPLQVGDFIAIYRDSDFYEIQTVTDDRGLTTVEARSIQQPIYYDGMRIQ